ncbi:MAG: hypothetical protein ACO1Q7_17110 [Gemmatimonas sp.]
MSNVRIAPTLATMAAIYALPRDGGPKGPRFAAYVARTPTEWGLVPYNPMAGDAALESVASLLALDAEAVALQAATEAATSCAYTDALVLAIAVRSKGLWTDRIATEVDERVTGKPRVMHQGVISLWSREESTRETVVRESVAEAVRVMWHAQHGVADTLGRVLACEGLAYALAELQLRASAHVSPSAFSAAITPEDSVTVIEALEVLGDTRQAGEIAGVLYGDDAAREMGWTTLGVPPFAGYRWAVARAIDHIRQHGSAHLLREPVHT